MAEVTILLVRKRYVGGGIAKPGSGLAVRNTLNKISTGHYSAPSETATM